MIDLHSHILPGIDDGASTPDVSMHMLQIAQRLGLTAIVATPHLHERLDPTYQSRVNEAHATLREIASTFKIDLLLGFEASLTPDLDQRLLQGELSTIGKSTSVLVDVPFVGWPLHADESFFRVQAAGFRPVLAHPERYEEIQRNPERALDLVDRGVLLQVTAGSFAGMFGKPAQRTAEMLLRGNAIHVVASDAHSAGQRFMAVKPGLGRLRALAGSAAVELLTVSNPKAILFDGPIHTTTAVHERTGSFNFMRVFQRLGSSTG
ncbi:MAG: tyrosine-protein phosphatase [Thermomicrobiales bacterium]